MYTFSLFCLIGRSDLLRGALRVLLRRHAATTTAATGNATGRAVIRLSHHILHTLVPLPPALLLHIMTTTRISTAYVVPTLLPTLIFHNEHVQKPLALLLALWWNEILDDGRVRVFVFAARPKGHA